MIDRLRYQEAIKAGSVVVYYFFDSSRRESLSTLTFLRCIAHQLLQTETLTPTMQQRLEGIFRPFGIDTEPEAEEVELLNIDLCQMFQKVTIVLDGINEVGRLDKTLILVFLRRIQRHCANLKLFIACEPEVDVSLVLGSHQVLRVSIRALDLKNDIRRFIDLQVDDQRLSGWSSACEEALVSQIKDILASKANGM